MTARLDQFQVVLFANLLIGRQRSTLFEKEDYLAQAEELMLKIVSMARQRYDIDFSADMLFKDGLVLHLQNLLERIQMTIRSPKRSSILSLHAPDMVLLLG